ncbi:hypothetical protein F5880DRAFT_1619423, partial [Lentinula raphanica]
TPSPAPSPSHTTPSPAPSPPHTTPALTTRFPERSTPDRSTLSPTPETSPILSPSSTFGASFPSESYGTLAELFSKAPNLEAWFLSQGGEGDHYEENPGKRSRGSQEEDEEDDEEDEVEVEQEEDEQEEDEQEEDEDYVPPPPPAPPPNPAHRGGCNRSGASVARAKRPRLSRTQGGSDDELNPIEEEENDEEDINGEEESNTSNQLHQKVRFVASSTPASPSPEVQIKALYLLSCLSLGRGTNANSLESNSWIEELFSSIQSMDWVEKGSALENLSLINLARRCLRGEVVNVSSTFIGMIHELYFAAKINSLLIYAEQENPSHKGALAPILAHLCEEGISPFQASKWFASGSRWGRLAAAGTVYILMVIAKIEGTASRLRGRSVSEKVLTTLANEIRAPTQESRSLSVSY